MLLDAKMLLLDAEMLLLDAEMLLLEAEMLLLEAEMLLLEAEMLLLDTEMLLLEAEMLLLEAELHTMLLATQMPEMCRTKLLHYMFSVAVLCRRRNKQWVKWEAGWLMITIHGCCIGCELLTPFSCAVVLETRGSSCLVDFNYINYLFS
jgi:hypothetical protein